MKPVGESPAYGWVHCTMAGFQCDRCETTRTLEDTMTVQDFQREAYDFLLRHKLCNDARTGPVAPL